MPSSQCQCALIAQTADAGPGLQVCHHYSNDELDPIIATLDTVINQFDVGINPEFVLETPLREQLEAYFRDVWDVARQQNIDAAEPDPGEYNPAYIEPNIRLVLTISFMRHMAIISQLLMATIVQHLNDSNLEPVDAAAPAEATAPDQPPDVHPEQSPDRSELDTEPQPDQVSPAEPAPEPADTPDADPEPETPIDEADPNQPETSPPPQHTADADNMPNMPPPPLTETDSASSLSQ